MVSMYKRAIWRMRFRCRTFADLQLLFGSVLVIGGVSLLVILLYSSSEPDLDMTVIDVSEAKQRQLVAEWKAQQARQEQIQSYLHPRLVEDGGGEERHRDLPQDGVHTTTTSRLAVVNIRRHAQPTARLRVQPAAALRVGSLPRPLRVNETAKAIRQQKVMQLLNRAADDSQRRSTSVDSVQVNTYDVRTQIAGAFDCVRLSMRPDPAVCLYSDAEDMFISRSIRHTGLWEPHILGTTFQNILYANSDIGVIDVGANIGIYSLVSAAMGHYVIAVEPYIGHLHRLHKAINLGKFEKKIVVVRDAMSDTRGTVSLDRPQDNQGGIHVVDGAACKGTHCVRTVYMDDLTEVAMRHIPSRRAVMKVDIEGHERHAFRRCNRLLDTIYVPYIFMEWQILRSFFVTDVQVSADRTMVIELIDYLLRRGYSAFSATTWSPLKTHAWFGWPDDVVWKHELADIVS